MGHAWTVDLTLPDTGHTWTRRLGDPPVLPEILDGLTIGWAQSDSPLWPTQPQPATCQFSLLAADQADLAGIEVGHPLHLTILLDGFTDPHVELGGRIGALTGTVATFLDPATGTTVTGWRLDVTAADYLADLTTLETYQDNLTPVAYTSGVELARAAVYGALTEAGTYTLAGAPTAKAMATGWGATADLSGPGDVEGDALFFTTAPVLPQGAALTVAADYLAKSIDAGPFTGAYPDDTGTPTAYGRYVTDGWRHGILRYNLDTAGRLDPALPYAIEWVARRAWSTGYDPLGDRMFTDLGGGLYGLAAAAGTLPPGVTPRNLVASSSYVDLGASWTRDRNTDPNIVTAVNPLESAAWTDAGIGEFEWHRRTADARRPSDPARRARLEDVHQVTGPAGAAVAESYALAGPENTWDVQTITWYASQDPQFPGYARTVFPVANPLWRGLAAPIYLVDLPTAAQLAGSDRYPGTLQGATWTFDNGEFHIGLELRPVTVGYSTGAGDVGYLAWDTTQTPATVTTNLVTNPSYETNLDGWTSRIGTGGTLTRDDTLALHGGWSLRVSGNQSSPDPPAAQYDVPITGDEFNVSAWVTAAAGTTVRLSANVRDGFTSTFPEETTVEFDNNAVWKRLTLPVDTSLLPGATELSLWIDAGGGTCHVDAVQVTTGPEPHDYFDGDTPDTIQDAYAWTGTPHGSTSTQTHTHAPVAGLQQTYPTVTWDQLEPTQTWDDYQTAQPLYT